MSVSEVYLESYIPELKAMLLDETDSMANRYRILFTLRNIPCDASVEAIASAFSDSSELLKHEVAYCLGQMGNSSAKKILQRVLLDTTQEPIVRHEAAEALAALDTVEVLPLLQEMANCDQVEVAETCQIAVRSILFDHSNTQSDSNIIMNGNPFTSVDPALACEDNTSEALVAKMMDDSLDLFDRYRALFALRNKNTEEASLAICTGFNEPKSALFRHEIAYVLGQLSLPATAPALIAVLENLDEHPMVRHEAAEALGGIITDDILHILTKYTKDSHQIVRESCTVALDMYEAEKNNDFQYANGIDRINQIRKSKTPA